MKVGPVGGIAAGGHGCRHIGWRLSRSSGGSEKPTWTRTDRAARVIEPAAKQRRVGQDLVAAVRRQQRHAEDALLEVDEDEGGGFGIEA